MEKIINATETKKEIDLRDPFAVSSQLLGDYVTLDWPHYQAIRRVRSAIFQYVEDRSRRRPLNIIMQAEPDSGKSHLVKCLAASIAGHNAVAIDYNMASLQSIEDLLQPLDSVEYGIRRRRFEYSTSSTGLGLDTQLGTWTCLLLSVSKGARENHSSRRANHCTDSHDG